MFKDNKKEKNSGFTVFEMVISITVIVVMLIFVLANYRSAGNNTEFSIILDSFLSILTEAQTKGVSGNLVEDPFSPPDIIYPNQGYAVYLDEALPSQVSIYGLHGVDRLEEEIINAPGVTVINLCGLPSPAGADIARPCTGPWNGSVASAEIIFNLSGEVNANIKDSVGGDLSGFDYIGGILDHPKSGQQAYFYVSLITGIAEGDIL